MTAVLTIDDILSQLSTEQLIAADSEQLLFPAPALEAAKAQWAEFWPHIVPLMQRMQADEELTDAEYQLLFYGVMLLGDMADLHQSAAFFEWVDTADGLGSDLEYTLGDALTEDLATLLFILSGGQSAPLQQLLLSDKAGIYVKAAALAAWFAQFEQTQSIDDAKLVPTLQAVIEVAARRGQKFVLAELAIWCIVFDLADFKPVFQLLLRQNKLDTELITSREIRHWQLKDAEKPLASGLVRSSFDVMSLQHWQAFQPYNSNIDELFDEIDLLEPVRAVSSKPPVGRNDPCPCGSGNKYKKCCGK